MRKYGISHAKYIVFDGGIRLTWTQKLAGLHGKSLVYAMVCPTASPIRIARNALKNLRNLVVLKWRFRVSGDSPRNVTIYALKWLSKLKCGHNMPECIQKAYKYH